MKKTISSLFIVGMLFFAINVNAECSCDATNQFKCKVKCCKGGSVTGFGKGTACSSFADVQ